MKSFRLNTKAAFKSFTHGTKENWVNKKNDLVMRRTAFEQSQDKETTENYRAAIAAANTYLTNRPAKKTEKERAKQLVETQSRLATIKEHENILAAHEKKAEQAEVKAERVINEFLSDPSSPLKLESDEKLASNEKQVSPPDYDAAQLAPAARSIGDRPPTYQREVSTNNPEEKKSETHSSSEKLITPVNQPKKTLNQQLFRFFCCCCPTKNTAENKIEMQNTLAASARQSR